jgi:hypothetical protein
VPIRDHSASTRYVTDDVSEARSLTASYTQTSNLGVGGSNPSERANDFNDLASTRRSRFEFKTVFRTINFFRAGRGRRVGQT